MEFYTQNGRKRPVRLSEKTRRFACDSLGRKYGLETIATPAVRLDAVADFETLSDIEKYDAAILQIAKDAPIRICEGEKISGAATLGLAIHHTVPAVYRDCSLWSSISHLTVDFAALTCPPLGLASLAVVAIFHTGVCYALYFGSIAVLPAQTSALFSYIDPVVAILLSALLLREPMDFLSAIGAVLILGSTLLGEVLESRKKQ